MRFRKSKSHEEAQQAVTEADLHLKKAEDRNDEVHEIAQGLREARNRNHFADQISVLMGRKPL